MSDGRKQLRAATRANALVVAAIVAALALPLAAHYTGFAPAGELKALKYPGLQWYVMRLTPATNHHGLDFSQIWYSAKFLEAGKPVYFKIIPFEAARKNSTPLSTPRATPAPAVAALRGI